MAVEKAYPTDFAGEFDAGAGITRVQLCTKRTWCKRSHEHDGPCIEVPRYQHDRPEWDRRTPDPTGWRQKR